jgi:23S rRNA (adenine2503-C2)-methyltransferase
MNDMQKKYLCDFAAVREWAKAGELPAYRAGQIEHWLCQTSIQSIDEMTDLPKPLRRQLAAEFEFWSTKIARHQTSPDGTEKLLLQLPSGGSIECVLLRDGIRRTICVSSQVGGAMGCVPAPAAWMASSEFDGLEIVEQMLRLQRFCQWANGSVIS